MYRYTIYGLRTHSALSFPNLEICAGDSADVTISFAHVEKPPASDPRTVFGRDFCVTNHGFYRFWDNVGTLLMRDGREILIDPAEEVTAEVLRSAVLGAGFGVLLHQRGQLVLHASALTISDAAVAFVGTSLQGKSTVALALYARGHHIIADDVTAIEVDGRRPTVVPAYPQINCWPQSLEQFSYDPRRLERVQPTFEKRAFHATRRFCEERQPLSHVFVLNRGGTPVVEPLTSREALIQLGSHSYCYRMFTPGAAARNMVQCARVLRTTSVNRLHTGSSLDEIPQAVQLVEDVLNAAK